MEKMARMAFVLGASAMLAFGGLGCGSNGAAGTNGANGANGASSLVNVTPLAGGAQCAAGGYQIQVGLDTNGDGQLEATEVQKTSFVCNGAPGSDASAAPATLVNVAPLAAGLRCPAGGYAIQTGVDTNGDGQLDPGEVQSTSYVCNGAPPSSDGGTLQPVALAAGAVHTCAMLADGTVWCWGNGSAGEIGPAGLSLGCPSTNPLGALLFPHCSLTPVLVPLPGPATAITASEAVPGTTCALLSDSSVWCWGDNSSGQLGTTAVPLTPTAMSGTPVKVQLPASSPAKAIAAGYDHVCAVLGDGSVWCWGGNKRGQLGTYATLGVSSPVPIMAQAGVSFDLTTALTAGDEFTCVLDSRNNVSCWGDTSFQELGPVIAGPVWASAVAGGVHICLTQAGVTSAGLEGTVVCYGDNSQGALGIGNTSTETSTNLGSPVLNLANATLLAAGCESSCAVVGPEGPLACWGENDNGELGNGTTTSSSTPVWVYNLANVSAVAIGGLCPQPTGTMGIPAVSATVGHTCAISDGTVWCWGNNGLGQLGNGTIISALAPVPVVLGVTNPQPADAGADHTAIPDASPSDAPPGDILTRPLPDASPDVPVPPPPPRPDAGI